MTDSTTTAPKKGAIHLTEADFEKTVLAAGMPVLVDFYADWCGPCKMAAPIIDKLADELRGKVLISKVNTDDAREIAQQFNIMSIPTVVILEAKDGKVVEVSRKIGFPGEGGYRQMLSSFIKAE